MKAQSRIINEILIFAVGIILVGVVVVIFKNAQASINEMSVKDQMMLISNKITAGIIKAINDGNKSLVRIQIPVTIAEEEYGIIASGNELFLYIVDKPSFNVTQKLFNINESYTINGESIGTRALEIVVENDKISLREVGWT